MRASISAITQTTIDTKWSNSSLNIADRDGMHEMPVWYSPQCIVSVSVVLRDLFVLVLLKESQPRTRCCYFDRVLGDTVFVWRRCVVRLQLLAGISRRPVDIFLLVVITLSCQAPENWMPPDDLSSLSVAGVANSLRWACWTFYFIICISSLCTAVCSRSGF